jgi:peptidyl-prolyl cis-trans isomerase C
MKLKVMWRLVALASLVSLTTCGSTSTMSAPPIEASTQISASTSATSEPPAESTLSEMPAPVESASEPPADVVTSPTPDLPLAVLVNGQPIYLADYERAVGHYEASMVAQGLDPTSKEGQEHLAERRDWLLNMMIEQVLTEQAAAAAGVFVSDEEVNAEVQQMIDEAGGAEVYREQLAGWGQTEEEAWQDVRAQLIGGRMAQRIIDGVPTTAEHVRARHILVDNLEEAERILAQLQASADFATLAKAYSQDVSTRDSGGDLGFFPRGILVAPEVEEVAFALQPGQFSGVISSMLGHHIVQVVERDPARPVSEENLRILREQALQEWVVGLWAQAEIQRFIETAP